MEFFVASSADVAAKAQELSTALRRAQRLTSVDGPLQIVDLGGTLIAAPDGEALGNAALCWDGHGIAGKRAFSSAIRSSFPLAGAETYINASLGSSQPSDMRGVFAMLRFNPNVKAYSVCIDPLSQYPLYVCVIGETLMASTSCYLIEAGAEALGYSLTRTAKTGAFEAAFGLGAGDHTGYREISFLPKDYMITGAGQNWRFVKSSIAGTLSDNYETLLTQGAERLTAGVAAIARSFNSQDVLFDLTGGLDSRLVFSAAIAAGIKNLTIFSGGADTSPDKQIAYQLGHRFGASVSDLPGNFNEASVYPLALARRAVFRQQGCSNNFAYGLGTQRLKHLVRVRGGGGELLRSFVEPPHRSLFWHAPLQAFKKISRGDPVYMFALSAYWRSINDKMIRKALPWANRYCESPASHHRFYRRTFLQYGTKAVLAALVGDAESAHTMAMDFYLKDRCRRHFGFMSQGLNQAYAAFEPLMDPVLVAAAHTLTAQERAAGKLTFDLMERLGGREILIQPFAPHSLTTPMRKALSQRLGKSERALRHRPEKLELLPVKQARTSGPPTLKTAGHPPAHYGAQAKTLWQMKDHMIAVVNALPTTHECWQYFNRGQLLASLNHEDYFFRNETTAGRGLRILYTLMWVAGDSEPVGIDQTL